MPKPGWASITLRTERLQALQLMYQRDPKRPRLQKFGAWLDNFTFELTSYEEELERYGPFLTVDSIKAG